MAGIQARTTRRLASPRTQLSRSAQDMVADWPLNSSDTQAVVSRAARRDVAKHKKLFQDREDLWVIAWLIAPMLPVALAPGTKVPVPHTPEGAAELKARTR